MNIENLCRKADYYNHDAPQWVRVIWRRIQSFNCFCKFHRDHLVSEGAMRRIGRDYFVDTTLFPQVAARIMGVTIESCSEVAK